MMHTTIHDTKTSLLERVFLLAQGSSVNWVEDLRCSSRDFAPADTRRAGHSEWDHGAAA